MTPAARLKKIGNSMDNTHPKIGIADFVFLVDTPNQCIRQFRDPGNQIPFDRMNQAEQGRRFYFDCLHGTAVEGPIGPNELRAINEIFLPATLLDARHHPPDAVVEKLNREAIRAGWNLFVLSEALSFRLMGRLPEVWIGNDVFRVDWHNREMHHVKPPYTSIEFGRMEFAGAGGYQFFYNRKDKCMVEVDDWMTEMPAEWVLVQLPDEYTLDAYAAAIADGLRELEYEDEFPYKGNHIARLIPLDRTRLPELIAENRKRIPGNKAALTAEGTLVMVHPELTADPHRLRGAVGFLKEVSGDTAQVTFPNEPTLTRAYQTDALLVLKPFQELIQELEPDKNHFLSQFFNLSEVGRLVASGTVLDLTEAFERVRGDDALCDRATRTLQQELERRTQRSQQEGGDAYSRRR